MVGCRSMKHCIYLIEHMEHQCAERMNAQACRFGVLVASSWNDEIHTASPSPSSSVSLACQHMMTKENFALVSMSGVGPHYYAVWAA